ncbi:hypothetical protein GCM10025876_28490 [Demequina litorisediminis]|uniref:Uncharacterized protein n=1 Tax=Demequina litorisediminis TaxID=1849022 RepID=A0ABQ6IH55_9MICO|nr:hypothetical protein GCM10025876_28490 [Demequina litorisediminis]
MISRVRRLASLLRSTPALSSLVAQEDVLGDGEALDNIEFLVHGRDAEFERGDGAVDGDGLAVPDNLALVGLVGAGQGLDEGGFAGAVLAQHTVDLAWAHLEVDSFERAGAAEGLHEAPDLE